MPKYFISIRKQDFTDEQVARFWVKVDRGLPEACWEWKGATATGKHNYGMWPANGTVYKPHRVAYVLSGRELSAQLTIDHLCRNKKCCNPAHLEAVPAGVNTLRQYNHHPSKLYQLTCKQGHPKEFGVVSCRRCLVRRVAVSMRKKPEKYRELRRLQKRRERERKRAELKPTPQNFFPPGGG